MVKDSKALHSMIFLAVLHIVPSTIIPCEEVIDRIISCIALTLNIQVIDIKTCLDIYPNTFPHPMMHVIDNDRTSALFNSTLFFSFRFFSCSKMDQTYQLSVCNALCLAMFHI